MNIHDQTLPCPDLLSIIILTRSMVHVNIHYQTLPCPDRDLTSKFTSAMSFL